MQQKWLILTAENLQCSVRMSETTHLAGHSIFLHLRCRSSGRLSGPHRDSSTMPTSVSKHSTGWCCSPKDKIISNLVYFIGKTKARCFKMSQTQATGGAAVGPGSVSPAVSGIRDLIFYKFCLLDGVFYLYTWILLLKQQL